MTTGGLEDGEGSLTGNDPFYDRFHWFKLVGRYVSAILSQSAALWMSVVLLWFFYDDLASRRCSQALVFFLETRFIPFISHICHCRSDICCEIHLYRYRLFI